MQVPAFQVVLMGAFFVIALCLLYVLHKNRLRSEFPIFFNYVTSLVVIVALQAATMRWSCPAYFYVYWSLAAVSMLFGFAVLYEVFVNALKPFAAVIDLGKTLFWWAAAFMLVTAVITAVATSGSGQRKVVTGIHLMEHSIQLLQCGTLLLLIAFEKRFGLSWRSHGMCIALGLGAYSALDMIMSYTRIHFPAMGRQLDLGNGLLSIGMFAFFMYGLSQPKTEKSTALGSPTRLILQRWDEALASATLASTPSLLPNTINSFIPGVEQAVDRVMSRKFLN